MRGRAGVGEKSESPLSCMAGGVKGRSGR